MVLFVCGKFMVQKIKCNNQPNRTSCPKNDKNELHCYKGITSELKGGLRKC